jgi:predicted short-subunit dehydrogenase-like oxidoreductase (DUF2520 family)
MLPGMQSKPVIAIVGAGNLANALAVPLRRAGYRIESVVGRSKPASRTKARTLAREVAARASTELPKDSRATVVWFCVPDGGIRKASQSVRDQIDWRGRIALHSSGVMTSDELDALRRRGAFVASAHPLMTFVRRSRPTLAGVPFAIEGDSPAVRIARRVVKDLGGRGYSIQKKEKAAYHAWGTFVSPLLTALMATAEQVAHASGISEKQSRERMIPILRQTLENYATLGASAGFSGPIVRGDIETVKRHWRALRGVPPARDVYRALLRAALQYLPAKNRAQLRRAVRG